MNWNGYITKYNNEARLLKSRYIINLLFDFR